MIIVTILKQSKVNITQTFQVMMGKSMIRDLIPEEESDDSGDDSMSDNY